MRQRNPFPVPVDLMETRDLDTGEMYGPVEVEPGGVVDWPIEIGGFELADDPVPDPAPEQPAPDSVEGQGAGAGPSKHPRKPGRASAPTDEEPAP